MNSRKVGMLMTIFQPWPACLEPVDEVLAAPPGPGPGDDDDDNEDDSGGGSGGNIDPDDDEG